MAGESSPSIERKVFLGKEGKNKDFKKKIDVAANSIHINRILNPSTKEEKDNQNLNATDLVKTLGGQDNFNVESVNALKQIKDDDRKTEAQKKIAEERLNILGKSVFWEMREGHDPVLQDLLGRASAVEIDKMLPDPLKGLGKEVVKNVITNPSILKGLRKLDDIRQNYDLSNPRDKALFLSKIENVYDEITEIEGLNDEEREQLHMVKAYLNTEMQGLSGENGEKRTGQSITNRNESVSVNGEDNRKEDEGEETVRLRGEMEIPREVEKQRDMARKLLDIIEFRHLDPWSLEASEYLRYLEVMRQSEEVDSEVKQEIIARLRVQLISGVMTGAGGWLGERTPLPISSALNKADGEGGLFDVDDMTFLLHGESGLSKSIAFAWDEFEEINIGEGKKGADGKYEWGSYHNIMLDIIKDKSFCKKMKMDEWSDAKMKDFISAGTHPSTEDYVDKEGYWSDAFDNYFTDANLKRKEIVRAFIAEKIVKMNGGRVEREGVVLNAKEKKIKYEAEKGVELAWNLMVASGETSIYNSVFAGHNDLSELMLTKFDTLDRMYKGKPIGAFTCMQDIVSLSPTWLRYMSDRTIFGPLKAKEIKLEKMAEITKYSIDYWYSSMITQKIAELKSIMRSEELTSKELGPAKLKQIGEWVGKVAKFPSIILDHHGKPIVDGKSDTMDNLGRPLIVTGAAKEKRERRIRFLLVAGWAEQAISNIDLGWDSASWKTFKDMLIREYSFDESQPDKKKSFVTKEEMDYIDSVIMNKFAGSYPKLKELELIRQSRKEGTWSILKAKPKSFDV